MQKVFRCPSIAGWFLSISFFLGAATAHAAPPAGALYAGALAGLSFINKDIGTKLGLGLHGGSNFHELMSAGVYVSYNGLGDQSLSLAGNAYTLSSNLWIFAVEGNYELEALLQGAYLGAKAGVGRTKTSIETSDATSLATLRTLGVEDTTSTDLVIGPAVGYRVSLQPNLTVGGEASFLVVTTTESTNLFNVLATATFWF